MPFAQHFTDARTKFSKEPGRTALSSANGYSGSTYDWLNEPGNEDKRETFGIAMRAVSAWEMKDAIVEGRRDACRSLTLTRMKSHLFLGFAWASLPEGSVVVDVGGGVGNILFPLYEQFSNLVFEVQELEQTCIHGQEASPFDTFIRLRT